MSITHGEYVTCTPTILTPMRPSLVVIVAAAALLAGCSGGGDATDTTIDFSTGTFPDPTAPTTTSRPTTTVAETTTTTAVPTTTIDPTTQLIADIEADLNAGEQALLAAAANPADPASETLVRTYFSGESLDSVLASLIDLAAAGLVARPNPNTPNTVIVRSIVETTGNTATVELCRVDAATVVEKLPNGTEIILNDKVTVYQSRSNLVKVANVWTLDSGTPIEGATGATTCE